MSVITCTGFGPEYQEWTSYQTWSRVMMISLCQLQYKAVLRLVSLPNSPCICLIPWYRSMFSLWIFQSLFPSYILPAKPASSPVLPHHLQPFLHWLLPPDLSLLCGPRACISDEQGNLSPLGLQRRQRWCILLCILPTSFLPSFPTWPSHNFSRCCLIPQHLSPSLFFSQFRNL